MTDPRINEIRELLPRAMLADWVRLGSRLVRLLRDTYHPGKHDEVLTRLLERAERRSRCASSAALRFHCGLPPRAAN
jgi:hypothetical protein